MRAVLGKWWEGGWSSGRDRCGVCGTWRAGGCGGDHHDRCFVHADVRQNIATGVFNTNVRLRISAGELLMLQGGWGCSVGGGVVSVWSVFVWLPALGGGDGLCISVSSRHFEIGLGWSRAGEGSSGGRKTEVA